MTSAIPPGGSLPEQFPSASPLLLFPCEPPARVIKTSGRRLCIILKQENRDQTDTCPERRQERAHKTSIIPSQGHSPHSRRCCRIQMRTGESTRWRNLPEVVLIRCTFPEHLSIFRVHLALKAISAGPHQKADNGFAYNERSAKGLVNGSLFTKFTSCSVTHFTDGDVDV